MPIDCSEALQFKRLFDMFVLNKRLISSGTCDG